MLVLLQYTLFIIISISYHSILVIIMCSAQSYQTGDFWEREFFRQALRICVGSVREIPHASPDIPKTSCSGLGNFGMWRRVSRSQTRRSRRQSQPQTQDEPSITTTNPRRAAAQQFPQSGLLRLVAHFWGISDIPTRRLIRLALIYDSIYISH